MKFIITLDIRVVDISEYRGMYENMDDVEDDLPGAIEDALVIDGCEVSVKDVRRGNKKEN